LPRQATFRDGYRGDSAGNKLSLFTVLEQQ
jgi:hypothetical protein